jgi:hypothetical protein
VDAICSRDKDAARHNATEHITKAIERSATVLMGAIRFGEAVFEPAPDSEHAPLRLGAAVRRV